MCIKDRKFSHVKNDQLNQNQNGLVLPSPQMLLQLNELHRECHQIQAVELLVDN